MIAEVAAHAVAADGFPVAEFNVAVIELEVDAAIVRNRILIRVFGGAAADQTGADAVEVAGRSQTGARRPSRTDVAD